MERDRLLEEEDKALSGIKSAPAKVTRAHIDTEAERERQRILKEKAGKHFFPCTVLRAITDIYTVHMAWANLVPRF